MILRIEHLKLLSTIAGSAIRIGKVAVAKQIFEALLPFCPKPSNGPLIGLAMANHALGDSEAAIDILREKALVDVPDCGATLVHLALIYSSAGFQYESDIISRKSRSIIVDPELIELLDKVDRGRFIRIFDS